MCVPQKIPEDLVTFTGKILIGKLYFLLRYLNKKPRFKLRWCCARDLFLWSLEFMVQTNLKYDTIAVHFCAV